jgi:hypothetical protein
MDRDFKDNQTLLGMLAAERKKVEELTAQREGDAVAWMTEDGRVATSYTKEHSMPKASKDAFNIPLYAAPPIASQREGEPVAWLVTREGDPAFPFVFIKEDMADRWISNVTLTPFAQKHPLYATPSPPRAVTDDDVHRAIAAQMKRVAEGGCTPFDSMRAALEAALSERTS